MFTLRSRELPKAIEQKYFQSLATFENDVKTLIEIVIITVADSKRIQEEMQYIIDTTKL